MEGNNLGEKRKSMRFPTNLKALYYLSNQKESVEKCRILNVSYNGFGIQFPMGDKIKTGSNINIGIVVQWQFMRKPPHDNPVLMTWRRRPTQSGYQTLLGPVRNRKSQNGLPSIIVWVRSNRIWELNPRTSSKSRVHERVYPSSAIPRFRYSSANRHRVTLKKSLVRVCSIMSI